MDLSLELRIRVLARGPRKTIDHLRFTSVRMTRPSWAVEAITEGRQPTNSAKESAFLQVHYGIILPLCDLDQKSNLIVPNQSRNIASYAEGFGAVHKRTHLIYPKLLRMSPESPTVQTSRRSELDLNPLGPLRGSVRENAAPEAAFWTLNFASRTADNDFACCSARFSRQD